MIYISIVKSKHEVIGGTENGWFGMPFISCSWPDKTPNISYPDFLFVSYA